MPPKKKKAGKKASKTKEVGGTKEQEMKKLELENEMLKMEVARNISLARKAQDGAKNINSIYKFSIQIVNKSQKK